MASTALRASTRQGTGSYDCLCATIAAAPPQKGTSMLARFFQDHQCAESLPSQRRAGDPLISSLHRSSRPAHIPGLIVAVIVDAVNRSRRRWSTTNIGQKVLIRCQPARADRDATSTIVPIAFAGLVIAAAFNFLPSQILRCAVRSVFDRLAMSPILASRQVTPQTPATLGITAAQIDHSETDVPAAITDTPDTTPRIMGRMICDDPEPSKALTCHIDPGWHGSDGIIGFGNTTQVSGPL